MTDLNVSPPLPFRQTIVSGPSRSPSPKRVSDVLLTLRVDLCSIEGRAAQPVMLANFGGDDYASIQFLVVACCGVVGRNSTNAGIDRPSRTLYTKRSKLPNDLSCSERRHGWLNCGGLPRGIR